MYIFVTYMYKHIHIYVYIYIHCDSHLHTYIYTYICLYMSTHTYTYICEYMCIHIYIYIYIYVRATVLDVLLLVFPPQVSLLVNGMLRLIGASEVAILKGLRQLPLTQSLNTSRPPDRLQLTMYENILIYIYI